MQPALAVSKKSCLITLACLAVAVGCGGGGGGGEIEPAILPLYAFGVSDTLSGEPFDVSFSEGGSFYTVGVTFPAPGLRGTFAPPSGDHTIQTGTLVDVDSDVGTTPLFGEFQVNVPTTIGMPANDRPSSGSFRVLWTMNVVQVDFTLLGVTMQINSNGPTQHSYEEFEDMVELPVPEYQQRASFAWGLLEYLVELTDMVSATFDFMGDELYFFNPRTANCDGFAPTYTGPPGIDDPGMYTFGWNDVNLDDDIGPGDRFTWSFFDCWQDDPFDDLDLLYETGSIRLENFTEVVTNNTLVRIGYEPAATDGGVFFNSLVESETEDALGTITIDQTRELNGSFQIAWWEP